jgi:hypothetical protein
VGKNTVETLAGVLFVALVAVFGFYAYTSFQSHGGNVHGYSLKARFNSADGITAGTDLQANLQLPNSKAPSSFVLVNAILSTAHNAKEARRLLG